MGLYLDKNGYEFVEKLSDEFKDDFNKEVSDRVLVGDVCNLIDKYIIKIYDCAYEVYSSEYSEEFTDGELFDGEYFYDCNWVKSYFLNRIYGPANNPEMMWIRDQLNISDVNISDVNISDVRLLYADGEGESIIIYKKNEYSYGFKVYKGDEIVHAFEKLYDFEIKCDDKISFVKGFYRLKNENKTKTDKNILALCKLSFL